MTPAGTTVLPIPMWATVLLLVMGAIVTLVTAISPVLLAMINRKQGLALANSNRALVNSDQALVNTVATKQAAEHAAEKVEAVRTDLKGATDSTTQELKAIHKSVNSDKERLDAKLTANEEKQDAMNAHILDLSKQIATLVAEKAAGAVAQNRRSTDPKPRWQENLP